MSEVSNFYNGRSVFITGATGFIGKVLVEKLLYSCKDLKRIFILIRNKDSKNDEKTLSHTIRFKELLQSKAFDRIRDECSDSLSKVIPVYGELSQPGLALSHEDEKEIVEHVTIFFHCAATVKFNNPLKDAINVNLLGTKNVFGVFKNCQNPGTFIYLSTAYSNCQRSYIEEKVYPTHMPIDDILKMHQELDSKSLESLTESLKEGRPNTYTLTKSLAESYLEENSGSLNVAIVRPSIVFHSNDEPIKGWGDSFGLYTSLVHAVSSGLVHNIPTDSKLKVQAVPVDFVTNILIVLAWSVTLKNCFSERLPVVNCVANLKKSFSQYDFINIGLKQIIANPSNFIMSYPFVSTNKNPISYNYGKIVNHYIPAIVLDALRVRKGKSPKYLKLYRRFFNTILPTSMYFLSQDFNFEVRNRSKLYNKLSLLDQNLFNFNEDSIEWKDNLENMFQGIRNYVVPHEYTDTEQARKNLNRLYWQSVGFNIFTKLAFVIIFLCLFGFIPIFGQYLNFRPTLY